MARYGNVVYKGTFYGEVPRTPFSVEPFTATAVDYDRILLNWNTPAGDLTGLRVVRNQEGFPESPEDGVVLYEANSTVGNFGATTFTDGETNFADSNLRNDIALVSGRWVYYRIWVRRSDDLWVIANDVFTVLPKKHGTSLVDGTELQSTQTNFMDLLPRVFSSAEQSPLGTIDPGSSLYQFLEGMSFTLDEVLTLADLLIPEYSNKNSGPGLLELKLAEYGLAEEEPDAIVRKKRLIREALYMYSRKGTRLALGTMIESLTGYAPDISVTSNLMLTVQDSSFYKGLGSWRSVGPSTLTLENKVITPESPILDPESDTKSIDIEYSAKVVTTGANARIENGTFRPTTRAIPLPEIGTYTLSYYAYSQSATPGVINASIVWYTENGVELSRTTTASPTLTSTWARYSVTGVSPGFEGEITAYSVTDDFVTLTLSEAHPLVVGQTIDVSGLGDPFDTIAVIAAVTSTTVTFPLVTEDVEETEAEGTITTERAVYAAVVLSFAAAATYYVDLVSFTQGALVAYEEPRGVNVFLNSNKANYLNNPSFVEEGTPWDVNISTWDYVPSTLPFIYAGETMLELGARTSGETVLSTVVEPQNLPVEKAYSFSVYLQTPDEDGEEEVTLTITATDGTTTATRTSEAFTITPEWSRPYIELYISDEFDSATLEFEVEITVTTNNGGNVNVEAAQLEVGYYPSDYFDGSFPPEYGVAWKGDENESASHTYILKQVKIIRLIQELENYLPSNTAYTITSHAGTEVTGITL